MNFFFSPSSVHLNLMALAEEVWLQLSSLVNVKKCRGVDEGQVAVPFTTLFGGFVSARETQIVCYLRRFKVTLISNQ